MSNKNESNIIKLEPTYIHLGDISSFTFKSFLYFFLRSFNLSTIYE